MEVKILIGFCPNPIAQPQRFWFSEPETGPRQGLKKQLRNWFQFSHCSSLDPSPHTLRTTFLHRLGPAAEDDCSPRWACGAENNHSYRHLVAAWSMTGLVLGLCINISWEPYEWLHSPTLQRVKLRHREVESLTLGHTGSRTRIPS